MFKDSVECIECHNAGMPVKVVFLPYVNGRTMQEKKEFCSRNLDHIRKMLTFEPRAGSNAYGVVVTNPPSSDAHFGAIYFDASGWRDMCGHATMCIGSLAVQQKLIPPMPNKSIDVAIDTPAGRVVVHVRLDGAGEVKNVSLANVPSYLHASFTVKIHDVGDLDVPIVFGGDFYGMVDLDSIDLPYSRDILPKLFHISSEIFDQLSGEKIVHPTLKGVKGFYGIRYQSMIDPEKLKMYGVLFFGSKDRIQLDRSPSGTSSSAHLAYLYYVHKKLRLHQEVEFLSSIGTVFKGKAIEEVNVGKFKGIVPEISSVDKGCFITGFSTYVVDADDKLNDGFQPLEPF